MRILTILPLLAAGTNKMNEAGERGYDGWGKISDISQYLEECLTQVPSKNGIFETANFGTSGEITLDDYKPRLRCKHVVQADSSCSEIKISYRSIAVMAWSDETCKYDGFRFSWTDNETGVTSVTPLRCNCFGDGCNDPDFEYYFDIANNNNYFDSLQEPHLGPEQLTIKSNSFTFYFESEWFDAGFDGGHVILDWKCVFPTTTTTTTTTTSTTTT